MSKQGRNKGADNFSHILAAFYGTPWCILPAKLAEIETVLRERIRSGHGFEYERDDDDGPTAASKRGAPGEGNGYTLIGSTAVVPINGTITARPSMFADFSGGTSSEQIGRAIDAAVNDAGVSAIALDIDSPGGSAAGLPDAAAKIASANKQKPVTAVVNHMAASAAYWLASQAGEIAVAPNGWAGCIGCILAHVDETKMEEMAGVKTEIVSSTQSPFKTEGYPQVPLTAAARADMQAMVDKIGQQFIDAVAKGRGIRSTTVERDFGQGRMKLADDAIAARMADRVATLEQVVQQINKRAGSSRGGSRAALGSVGASALDRKSILARVAEVIEREEQDDAERLEHDRAARRPAARPHTPEEIRRAAYRAERGLPTN